MTSSSIVWGGGGDITAKTNKQTMEERSLLSCSGWQRKHRLIWFWWITKLHAVWLFGWVLNSLFQFTHRGIGNLQLCQYQPNPWSQSTLNTVIKYKNTTERHTLMHFTSPDSVHCQFGFLFIHMCSCIHYIVCQCAHMHPCIFARAILCVSHCLFIVCMCGAQQHIKSIISAKYGSAGSWGTKGLSSHDRLT